MQARALSSKHITVVSRRPPLPDPRCICMFVPDGQGAVSSDDNDMLLDAGALPCDFDADVLDEDSWGAQADVQHAAVRPFLTAHNLSGPCELGHGEVHELAAANARPGTAGWEALYADHPDELEALR